MAVHFRGSRSPSQSVQPLVLEDCSRTKLLAGSINNMIISRQRYIYTRPEISLNISEKILTLPKRRRKHYSYSNILNSFSNDLMSIHVEYNTIQ